ncbi:MAG: peptidase M23B [Marinobacter sp. T13-3]|nr:MAG: peptidase M23B [Marinobacter sp. T13-3]
MNTENVRFYARIAAFAVTLALLAALAGYGFAITQVAQERAAEAEQLAGWQQTLERERSEVAQLKQTVQQRIDTLTMRVGQLQGRMLRLDALGQHFIDSGLVADSEFNFDQPAAVGGPVSSGLADDSFSTGELSAMITQMERQLEDRARQLRILDKLVSRQQLEDQQYVEGRPVTWGWVSSKYGYRSDPFNGRRAWHAGIDVAGRDGGDVISVAGGVVSFAGDRHGYGNLVEINHGDGLVTRYGHAKSLAVKVGDVVEKGQLIAQMGSTGRSTGPHVHFEVIRNGRTEDPEKYMHRASR